jgi:hypothetical protein
LSTYNYNPEVEWSSADNQTVTGSFTLSAKAFPHSSGTATIKKWCLTVDGSPVTTNVASSYITSSYATFNADTGCWTRFSTSYNLTNAIFSWDSTTWTNGSHTYSVTVTDSSDRTASSGTLTLSTYNYNPEVEWSSADNRTVTGAFTLSAKAFPHSSGTATIKKWCLTVDGSPVTTNVASSYITSYYATFNADTGCWTRTSTSYNLTDAIFSLSTSLWQNKQWTIRTIITDSSDRTASSDIAVTTSNPIPATTIAPTIPTTTIGRNSSSGGTTTTTLLKKTVTATPVTQPVAIPSNTAYLEMSAKPRVLTLADKTASVDITFIVDSKSNLLLTLKKASSSKTQRLVASVTSRRTINLRGLAPNTRYQLTAEQMTNGSKSAGLKIFFYTKAMPKGNATKSPSSSKKLKK